MAKSPKRRSSTGRIAKVAARFLLVALVGALAVSAAAARPAELIVLPGATSAEGIAAGRGSTFYAGDLFIGDIFRGDVRKGTAAKFIDAPDGRNALGMASDLVTGLLFVAGGAPGRRMSTTPAPVGRWRPISSARPTRSSHQRRRPYHGVPGSPTR